MMPDDPRHGTTRGYNAGCHEACCRAVIAEYARIGRASGARSVPAIGAQRRIRALMRIGWTSNDIAAAAGWQHRNYVLRILNGQKGKPTTWIERPTADAISTVYDRLSMRPPSPTKGRLRTRSIAARRGYASPLAWDDEEIDDPKAKPRGLVGGVVTRGFDESAVLARMAGDRAAKTRGAENVEVVRRMLAASWSQNGIRRHTGLKVERYLAVAA